MTVDFIEEALSSGLRITNVFTIPKTSDPKLRRLFAQIFNERERQMAFLTTASYDVRILIPAERRQWVEPLLDKPEVLHKHLLHVAAEDDARDNF